MDLKRLRELVIARLSTWGIARELDTSQTNVRYWLKKIGLSTIRDHLCECGETDPERFMNKGGGRKSKTRCKKCHARITIDRFRRNKEEAVAYLGGKCVLCGYDKCVGSLHFHHPNPAAKPKNWRSMKSWNLGRIKKALDGCELLCANCHGETHWAGGDNGNTSRLHREDRGSIPRRSTLP